MKINIDELSEDPIISGNSHGLGVFNPPKDDRQTASPGVLVMPPILTKY